MLHFPDEKSKEQNSRRLYNESRESGLNIKFKRIAHFWNFFTLQRMIMEHNLNSKDFIYCMYRFPYTNSSSAQNILELWPLPLEQEWQGGFTLRVSQVPVVLKWVDKDSGLDFWGQSAMMLGKLEVKMVVCMPGFSSPFPRTCPQLAIIFLFY